MDSLSLTPPSDLEPEIYLDDDLWQKESEQIDEIVQTAVLVGDPQIVFGHVRQVMAVGRLKAYGVAKAIHATWKRWPDFQKQGVEDDWENVAPALCGLSLDQCRRYRDIYEDIFLNPEVPEIVKPKIARKSMRAQYALLAPARDGSFTGDQWESVADAVTEREVKKIVREVRGESTSSKTRLVLVEGRDHIVRAREGDGPSVIVAVFRSSREDLEGDDYEHRVRRNALARLRSPGVVQR